MKDKTKKVWEAHMPLWEVGKIDQENILLKWSEQLRYSNILDEGCSIGQFSIELAKKGHKVTGVDISEKLIQSAKINCFNQRLKCNFVIGDVRNLPFEDKTFDAVLSPGVIEHVKETDKCLKEINRVLKTRGVLLINVPYGHAILYLINKKFQQAFGLWRCGYEKSFSKRKFSKMLSQNGFSIKKIRISRIAVGKRLPIYSKFLRIMDEPLYKLGFGGHHIFFYCIKNEDI